STFTTSGNDRVTYTEKAWNANMNDAKYVGWMFGGADGSASISKEQAQTNTTDSDLKEQWVDLWYTTNIEDKGLSKYIGDEIFCNDRSLGGSNSTYTNLGYGKNATNYAAKTRFYYGAPGYTDATPTFKCKQKNDAFTVSDTTTGNGSLSYPVALVTADEIVAAGSGKFGTANYHYYLYKSSEYWYWSFSPCNMASSGSASVFAVNSSGYLDNYYAYSGGAVAPVINIAPEYAKTLVGEGTMTSPYQIPGVE
ncbi:MAG TPA: hypothetical protein DCY94_04940, partial [Firmicutes bacterium]|nr:hypothetical protein [Bacillota bacterium]